MRSTEQVRLSLNVNQDVARVLKSYAEREGVSITEAARRAVSVFKYVDETQQRGGSIAVRNADSTLTEIRFL
nr:CopG transcriptional regulator [uncultured bacterium]